MFMRQSNEFDGKIPFAFYVKVSSDPDMATLRWWWSVVCGVVVVCLSVNGRDWE